MGEQLAIKEAHIALLPLPENAGYTLNAASEWLSKPMLGNLWTDLLPLVLDLKLALAETRESIIVKSE